MCGIIACIGTDDAVGELVTGLENLEYRGYDSAGIAVQNGSGLAVRKRAGKISELKDHIASDVGDGSVGIGHTRWSTHGPPTDANAHPHVSQSGGIAVVHNGIIDNYEQLRRTLQEEGYVFTSDTDSEVVPHLIEYHVDQGADIETAFARTVEELEGSYALVVLVEGSETVYATRQDSPLVLGVGDAGYYLASDVPAFLEFTDEVVYLEDGDVAVVSPTGADIRDHTGTTVSRDSERIEWSAEETGKGRFEHYMLKEIHTQPEALRGTLSGRIDDGAVDLETFSEGSFEDVEQVHLVACGTSYHAALCGERQLVRAGIPATTSRASEYFDLQTVDENTLVVAVTQSGETADTLSALRRASSAGARTLALTNVVGSTVSREADDVLYIRAGPEIGVAATKTFTSQVATLTMLTHRIAQDSARGTPREDAAAFFRELDALPERIEDLIDATTAQRVSEQHIGRQSYFFIGRDFEYPVALEGALKFKEITYEHAEGFASGELKHGPLALVTSDTTLFALLTGARGDETRRNAEEARTRGATVVAIAPEGMAVGDVADEVLRVPDTHPDLAGLLANVQLQLISYHTAYGLGREIDKPRNLAKSVTVE
ncbi:glutamine--fructose-6-phosphate transaminase (isomerizing) [Halomarina ordinaria]|uniref:Glutamine--fructose-6-phosphate aminotransferase [isomerizing] n=1 Tax=Halomarina ordinaria TaxID=3033939 RepID=A0ABD5UD39_9EURY|nr:glutamine--fructose-6-phosphate transaminase (isomerizing) [Halomarina sp. PSRA2]